MFALCQVCNGAHLRTCVHACVCDAMRCDAMRCGCSMQHKKSIDRRHYYHTYIYISTYIILSQYTICVYSRLWAIWYVTYSFIRVYICWSAPGGSCDIILYDFKWIAGPSVYNESINRKSIVSMQYSDAWRRCNPLFAHNFWLKLILPVHTTSWQKKQR